MSDIWERKVRTHFRRKDLDKDGVITRKDFLGMAARFADLEKFTPSQKETSIKCFDKIFSHYVKAAGEHCDIATEDLMVESLRTQRDDPEYRKCFRDLLLSILGPLNVSNDDHLTSQEFRQALENAGIAENGFAREAFKAMDTDNDGKLSFEDIIASGIAYMCSDEANTTAIFGMLV